MNNFRHLYESLNKKQSLKEDTQVPVEIGFDGNVFDVEWDQPEVGFGQVSVEEPVAAPAAEATPSFEDLVNMVKELEEKVAALEAEDAAAEEDCEDCKEDEADDCEDCKEEEAEDEAEAEDEEEEEEEEVKEESLTETVQELDEEEKDIITAVSSLLKKGKAEFWDVSGGKTSKIIAKFADKSGKTEHDLDIKNDDDYVTIKVKKTKEESVNLNKKFKKISKKHCSENDSENLSLNEEANEVTDNEPACKTHKACKTGARPVSKNFRK